MKIYPIFISGGSGTQLWPFSRSALPKRLLPLVSGRTLLKETATRLAGLTNSAQPILICTARITRYEAVFLISENQSTFIPLGTPPHRLENPGTLPLDNVEIQSGGYLSEDDIVRFEDLYRRHQ